MGRRGCTLEARDDSPRDGHRSTASEREVDHIVGWVVLRLHDGGRILRASSDVADSVSDGLSSRSERRMRPVELPRSVLTYDDGTEAPVLRRLFAQRAPPTARTHERENVGARHGPIVRIQHDNRDALRRPRPGHAFTPCLIERGDRDGPIRIWQGTGGVWNFLQRRAARRPETESKQPEAGLIVVGIERVVIARHDRSAAAPACSV